MSAAEEHQDDAELEAVHERAREGNEILRIEGLYKHFPIRAGLFKRVVGAVHAVDGVDLSVQAGETLALNEPGGKAIVCPRCNDDTGLA